MVNDLVLVPPVYVVSQDHASVELRNGHIVCKSVTESNKDRLFQKEFATSSREPRRQIAKSILQRLQQLDPNLYKQFEFKRNDRVEAPLRLLSEVVEVAEGGAPQKFESYIALSYCWHSSAWKPVTGYEAYADLMSAGWHWPISKTMFQALLDMRQTTSEGIWIDAISINQADDHERVVAIEAMNVIYKSARLVVIVLEDVEISSYEEGIIQECETKGQWASNFRTGTNDWHPANDQMRPLAAALITILSARWFGRAFCSQEIHLAKESVFLVPASKRYVKLHGFTLEWMHLLTIDYVQRDEDLFDRMADVSRSYDLLARTSSDFNRSDTQHVLSRPYLSMFRDLLLLGCSKLKDKLLIAINLSSLELSFNGNIEDIEQCRRVLALLALAAGDGTILCCQGDQIISGTKCPANLGLQWPGDDDSLSMMPEIHPRLADNAQTIMVEGGQLCLDLLVLKSTLLQRPTFRSSVKAKKFISCCMREHAEVLKSLHPIWHGLDDTTTSPELRAHLPLCRDVIACSLDCGLDRIAAEATIRALAFWPSHAGTAEPLLDPISTYLLSDISLNDSDSYVPQKIMSFCHEYIAFIFTRTHEELNSAARLVFGISDQIGITPFHNTSGNVLAVPTALASSEFCTLRRLWYLKPVGRAWDSVWQIVRKEILFGAPSITADGEYVELRTSQRITA